MKKIGFPQNIQVQLPLTYAGIALLTAALIGAILILMLGNYYQALEQDYLTGNAIGIARNLHGYAAHENIGGDNTLQKNAAFFQSQAKVTAFLSQTRVRIFDENRNLVADSGTPTQAWYIRLPATGAAAAAQPDSTPDNRNPGPPISFSPAPLQSPQQRDSNPLTFGIPASRNMFGFMLQDVSSADGKRSNLKSEAAFYDQNGMGLGYIEISEGPEYGRNILNNVSAGWGIASLIALVASAAIGWFISRQIIKPIIVLERVTSEMKEGNLSARAPQLKPAELASLSDTFNEMAIRIEGNIHTLHRFVSDAAHELRTPLTALRADLDLALREKDETQSKKMVSRSLEQVTRLEQLSKDLLDLSRIETQNDQGAFQPIDLPQLLLKASEVHASASEQAGIDFQLDLPGMDLKILGNDIQLQRALDNLLENAVKFSAAGGRITLKLAKEGESALITVEDNGIGIPANEREFLFNRFHRGLNAHDYPGSGLGLAIAKAIVEKHHGEIGVRPSHETTCFYIRMPLSV